MIRPLLTWLGTAVAATSVIACFEPSLPDRAACGANGECPDAQHCEVITSTCVPETWPEVVELRFEPLPAAIEAGVPVDGVSVLLLDDHGLRVPVSGGQFSLALEAGTTGAALVGTATGTAVAGVVSFAGLGFDRPGRGLTLTVQTGEQVARSARFDVLATRAVVSEIEAPAAAESCTSVGYTLAQAQGLPVDVVVEVDPDGDGPAGFRRATQAASDPGRAGVQGAPSLPAGRRLAFAWNTSADVPGGAASVQLRFTPRLAGESGAAVTTPPFEVRNGLRFERHFDGPFSLASMAVPDVDGDGWPDFVTGVGTTAKVLFGHSGNHADVTLTRAVWDVTVGDLDGDGRRDLAVATDGTGIQIAFASRTLRRQLEPPVAIASPANVRRVVTADFDRDGLDDLAGVDADSGAVFVLLQRQEQRGTFHPALVPWPGGGVTGSLAVADVNHDRWPDLVIGRASGSVVVVVQSYGEFYGPDTAVGISGAAVAVGDLNGDGRNDIVSVDGAGLHVKLASPAFPSIVVFAQAAGSALLLGDVDSDGRLDVVTSGADGVSVHLHVADRQALGFEAPLLVDAVGVPLLATADMDRDGRVDLLGGGLSTMTVSRFMNATPRRCGAGLGGPRGRSLGYLASGFSVVDFNSDGKLDLIADAGPITVALGLGNGELDSPTRLDAAGYPQALVTADMDGNGTIDLVEVFGDSDTITVLLQDRESPGTFREVELASTSHPWALATGDWNGDGALDLLTMGGSRLELHPGDPTDPGAFLPALTLPGVVDASDTVCAGSFRCQLWAHDLDLDARPEIVARAGDQLMVYRPDPAQPLGFLAPTVLETSGYFRVLAIGDVLDDGRAEVLAVSGDSPEYRLDAFQLTAEGTLVSRWFSPSLWPSVVSSLAIVDLDGDGVNEAVASGGGSSVARIFSPRQVVSGQALPSERRVFVTGRLAAADMNGDDRPDLIACDGACLIATAHGAPGGLAGGSTLGPIGLDGSLALGDLDGDGLQDLASLDADGLGVTLARQLAHAPGRFEPLTASVPAASFVSLADLDNDGDADLVTDGGEGKLIYGNDGHGGFGFGYCAVPQDSAQPLLIEDVDGDGWRDLLMPVYDALVLIRMGDFTCEAITEVMSLTNDFGEIMVPRAIAVADVDLDGRRDVVVITDSVWVALQHAQAPGTFAPAVQLSFTGLTDGAVGDVDRDGRVDLVLALGGDVSLHRGNPLVPGTWLPGQPLVQDALVDFVQLADVDGNGWLDLLLTSSSYGTSVYVQDGSEEPDFVYAHDTLVIERDAPRTSARVTDLDADGRVDLVVAGDLVGSALVRGR